MQYKLVLRKAFPFFFKTNDVERDQARVRVTIEVIALIYLLFSFYFSGFDQHELYTIFYLCQFIVLALLIYVLIRKYPGHYVSRKLFVAVLDTAAITFFMYRGEETGAIFFPLYLWVTIGTGFRYGRRYLFFSQLLSIAGFLFLCRYSWFWSEIETIHVFLAVLIIIPIYATSLIRRLTEAIEKAREASEAKSRFVSNMSHEIRTPLHGIIGIGELLSLRNYDEEYRGLCERLSKSAQLLLQLLNDVLDFSKIESGQFEIVKQPFNLHDVVTNISDILFAQVDQKSIRTDLIFGEDLSKYWIGDSKHIQQVLMNLIGNAVKFTEQGSITLSVSLISQKETSSTIRFLVKDSGIGMSPEFLTKIFDRFSQESDLSQTRYKGTGLGTTIAKQLVEAMGGSIGVESAPNIGSKFWFDLPMEEAEEAAINVPAPQELKAWNKTDHASRKDLRVLVAEDNETNQIIISKILETAGFSFELATDGEAALDKLLEEKYDVALLDMQMPGLTGIEVCKAYKMIHHDDKHIKFIMLSANVDHENQQLALQTGFSFCLPKPIESATLLSLIDQVNVSLSNPELHVAIDKNENADISIVDPVVLTELANFSSNDGFLREVLQSFDLEILKNLKGIETDLANSKFILVKGYAHAMRGTSSNVGAVALRNIAASIEKMTANELVENVGDLLPQLRILHEESVRLLNTLVNELENAKNEKVML